jgi:hypothetical protein
VIVAPVSFWERARDLIAAVVRRERKRAALLHVH